MLKILPYEFSHILIKLAFAIVVTRGNDHWGPRDVFFELYDNLLEFQLVGVLHDMGMDRWVPIVNFYSDDMWQQAFVELEQAGLLMEVPVS